MIPTPSLTLCNPICMASALKNLSAYDDSTLPAADEMSFGIVVAEWNADITHALYEGCYDTLLKHGAKPEHIHTLQVPGSFELPAGARILSNRHQVDAVICLGCVIRGETAHNEYINHAVAHGLVSLSIATGRPYIFGVLTPNDEQQARDRAGGKHGNKGVEAAITAIRMAALKREKPEGKRTIGF
ncbi:MAG TPA: 6,7-dimethyl-8-ribityllumazine synthase [Saprospiraceae bacterium]|nr:6,7-dimethyl-8-ribityllumazine synthase [Saprospiraceae bacterium]HND88739.1 6,7-dimethyl-8-ribityllumazine synthase [Saprospiraceae bacterium]